MLTSDSLREISNIFCGDTTNFYTYKQGYKLVDFFNSNFGTKDVYRSGFPSRWAYVHDKLVDLQNVEKVHFPPLLLQTWYCQIPEAGFADCLR